MVIIDHLELLALMRSGRSYRLVYGAEPDRFRQAHIPGSVAFGSPADAVRVLGNARHIVVYGPDEVCPITEHLYDLLRARSPHVDWYRAGLSHWARTGHAIEGTHPPEPTR